MKNIDKLELLFSKFPGIGKRQAKRFVYFVLSQNKTFLDDLVFEIQNSKKENNKCLSCNRFFENINPDVLECSICLNPSRQNSKILILNTEPDFENIEKSGHYKGKYFLVGQNLRILEKKPEEKIDIISLLNNIEKNKINEVIFALSVNPEGENTKKWMWDFLSDHQNRLGFSISELGRGLSIGSELEYSDESTIKAALENRK